MPGTGLLIGLHVVAVLLSYGLPLAYPLLLPYVRRCHPEAMPGIHDVQHRLNLVLTGPGTVLVLAFGLWTASRENAWGEPFVQVGFAAIAIIAIVGGWIVRASKEMAGLSRADVAAAAAGGIITWSAGYDRLYRRYVSVETFLGVVVLATVLVMAIKP